VYVRERESVCACFGSMKRGGVGDPLLVETSHAHTSQGTNTPEKLREGARDEAPRGSLPLTHARPSHQTLAKTLSLTLSFVLADLEPCRSVQEEEEPTRATASG
jgi:hypothetical protein